MIKKILKYCVPAYILSGIIAIIVIVKGPLNLTKNPANLFYAALFLVICAVIVAAIGLLLGLIPSILIQRPSKEKIFYWAGQIVSFISFCALFVYAMVHDPNKRTNAQENEATILSLTDNGNEYFGRVAFDSLKLKFRTPDDLILDTYTVFEQDSLINSQRDSIYTIYFSYRLKDNQAKTLMAKYLVIDHRAILTGFDIDRNENAEYMRVYQKQEALKDSLKKYENLVN